MLHTRDCSDWGKIQDKIRRTCVELIENVPLYNISMASSRKLEQMRIFYIVLLYLCIGTILRIIGVATNLFKLYYIPYLIKNNIRYHCKFMNNEIVLILNILFS